jgi:polyisoprenoid-binding protein YceI
MRGFQNLSMRSAGVILGLFLTANALLGADSTRYQGVPRGSSVKIDGTSTVHDWTVEGKLIGGFMDVDGEFPSDLSVATVPVLTSPPKVNVQIPVRSIKSGKSTMDSVMHTAMKQSKHRMISFSLTKMDPSSASRKVGDPLSYNAEGDLTVAGVKKHVKMLVDLVSHGAGGLRITGKTKVKMTDFGITPPAPKIALGLIKTGDEVDITFEWITKRRQKK